MDRTDYLIPLGHFLTASDRLFLSSVSRNYRDIIPKYMKISSKRRISDVVSDGHLEQLLYLKSLGYKIKPTLCEVAAKYGHTHIIKWFINQKYFVNIHKIFCNAGLYGHKRVIQFMLDSGYELNAKNCASIAEGGHLELLQLALDNGCPCDIRTCGYAARSGHLELLQWAITQGLPFNPEWTYAQAAFGRQLHVLKWLKLSGYPWNDLTCMCAAKGGHLEIIKWAYTNGAPVTSDVFTFAAESGHIDIMMWYVIMRFPIDYSRAFYNAKHGNASKIIFEYIISISCPLDQDDYIQSIIKYIKEKKYHRQKWCIKKKKDI